MAIHKARLAELSQAQLFNGVDLTPLEHLLWRCRVLELQAEEQLIRLGDSDGHLYVVLEGEFGVHVQDPEDEAIAIVKKGDSVGELAALDRKPRSAAVVARGPSRVLAIQEDVFWSLMGCSHRLALNLLEVLGERLRGNNATIADTRRLQAQYKRHASTDTLTGLINRRGLWEIGERLLRRFAFTKRSLSLMMIDVDHFKRFNDDHGHQAGDFALFAVAQVLRGGLRPTDFVARYGGEEFTVLLPETPLAGARIAAERVRELISSTPLVTPEGVHLPRVTVSIGVAKASDTEHLDTLIRRADEALYEAKRNGRNRVELSGAVSAKIPATAS